MSASSRRILALDLAILLDRGEALEELRDLELRRDLVRRLAVFVGLVLLRGEAVDERADRARVVLVDREGLAERALGVERPREDLLVDARESEERGDPRPRLLAARDDVLQGVDGLGPRALRDEELRQREEGRDVIRRGLAHLAHRFDRDARVAHLVARDARDLGAEENDRVLHSGARERGAEDVDEALAAPLLGADLREARRRDRRARIRVERLLEELRGALGALARVAEGVVGRLAEE
ncbi:MAG: hypothetical protein QM702_21015 [Rubrivivax sp.]